MNRIHLVWAVIAASQAIVILHVGTDGAKAEEVFTEHHLDGDYESVHWAHELRHFRHTTPAKDGCEKRGRCHEVQGPSAEDLKAAVDRIAELEGYLKTELEVSQHLRQQLSAAQPVTQPAVAGSTQEAAVESPAADPIDEPAPADPVEATAAAEEAPKKAKAGKAKAK